MVLNVKRVAGVSAHRPPSELHRKLLRFAAPSPDASAPSFSRSHTSAACRQGKKKKKGGGGGGGGRGGGGSRITINTGGVRKKGGGGGGGGSRKGSKKGKRAPKIPAPEALNALASVIGANVSYSTPGDSPPFQCILTVGRQTFRTKKKFTSKKLAKAAAAESAVAALKAKVGAGGKGGKGGKGGGAAKGKGKGKGGAAAKGKGKGAKKEVKPTGESLDADMDGYWDADPKVAAAKKKEALESDLDGYFSAPKPEEGAAEAAPEAAAADGAAAEGAEGAAAAEAPVEEMAATEEVVAG